MRIQCVGWNHQAHLPAEQCEGRVRGRLPKRANEREAKGVGGVQKSHSLYVVSCVFHKSSSEKSALFSTCCSRWRLLSLCSLTSNHHWTQIQVCPRFDRRASQGAGRQGIVGCFFLVYRHCGIWCVLNPPSSPSHHTTWLHSLAAVHPLDIVLIVRF